MLLQLWPQKMFFLTKQIHFKKLVNFYSNYNFKYKQSLVRIGDFFPRVKLLCNALKKFYVDCRIKTEKQNICLSTKNDFIILFLVNNRVVRHQGAVHKWCHTFFIFLKPSYLATLYQGLPVITVVRKNYLPPSLWRHL